MGRVRLGGDGLSSPSVQMQGEAVDAEFVGQEAKPSVVPADAVSAAEPEDAVAVAVNAPGHVVTPVEPNDL